MLKNYRRNREIERACPDAFAGIICGQGREPYSRLVLGDFSGGYNTCGAVAVYNLLYLCGIKMPISRIIFMTEKTALLHIPFMKKGALGANAFGIRKILGECGLRCRITFGVKKCNDILNKNIPAVMLYQDKKKLFMHFAVIRKSGDKFTVYNRYNDSRAPADVTAADYKSLADSFGGRPVLIISPSERKCLT